MRYKESRAMPAEEQRTSLLAKMLALDSWRIYALVIGGVLAVLAAAISFGSFARTWHEAPDLSLLFGLRVWLGVSRPVPENVLLVPVDGRAASRLFLPKSSEGYERCRDVRLDEPHPDYKNPEPPEILARWPRCLHARALDTLAVAQPDAVVLDISFRPRSDPSGVFAEQDRALAAAIRRFGRVVLALKIKSEIAGEREQPIVGEIEGAALAVAPFLLLGDQQRVDRFCAFKENGWSGACLPAVTHQIASLGIYAELHKLLVLAAAKNLDLLRAQADELLAQGALQAPVGFIRYLVSDRGTTERMRALLASDKATGGVYQLRLRTLTDMYLGPAIRYFNFYGPPGTFKTLRYEALVAGPEAARLPPGSLRGKVVFVGFAETARSEQVEHFETPFTTSKGVKLSGVELAATAYANLQDGSAITPAAGWLRAAIALSFGVLCTFFCVFLSLKRALLFCLALAIIYCALVLSLFERSALWLPLLLPLGFTASGALASVYFELRQQRDLIGNLLPEWLAEKLASRKQNLAGLDEHVYAICVSTDAKESTRLTDGLGDEMTAVLKTYFEALFRIVKESGGETVDTAGDAMTAIWRGEPSAAALHKRACTGSLRLYEATERFGRSLPERMRRLLIERFGRETADAALATRIGVDCGPMTLSMIGGQSRRMYHAFGHAFFTAARLRDLNKTLGTCLLVSRPVIDGLDGFVTRDLGRFELRGKTHKTQVYELIVERADATPGQLELCRAFASALADYDAGRLESARVQFAELKRGNPGDGPSGYYEEVCAMLERIAELIQDKKHQEAGELLAKLRKDYPDCSIPEAVLEQMKDILAVSAPASGPISRKP